MPSMVAMWVVVWFCLVWCDVEWCVSVWRGVVCFSAAWCSVVWCCGRNAGGGDYGRVNDFVILNNGTSEYFQGYSEVIEQRKLHATLHKDHHNTTTTPPLSQGRKWNQGSELYGKVWQKGDIIGCMLDITDKTICKMRVIMTKMMMMTMLIKRMTRMTMMTMGMMTMMTMGMMTIITMMMMICSCNNNDDIWKFLNLS